MELISKRNIIQQGFNNTHISPKNKIEEELNNYKILDDDVVEQLKKVLDNPDLVYTDDIDNDILDMVLMLIQKNQELSSKKYIIISRKQNLKRKRYLNLF